MKAKLIAILVLLAFAAVILAQSPAAPQAGQQRPPQPPLTPEQEKIRAEAQARQQRPMDKLDSIWLEELTEFEVKALIEGGKTTGMILTGGIESNGPHLASGKHNYVLNQTGEAMARKLGNALVAPIVNLEPGQVDRPVGGGWPFLSQATYLAMLIDIGDSMRGMGFKNIVFFSDSGGNNVGIQKAANALNDKYKGNPARFYAIEEYYDYAAVHRYIQQTLKIPEQMFIGESRGWSDQLHEEYLIDAVMALEDPDTIRFHQRVKAGRAFINGIPLEPLAKLQENGRKFVEFRANLGVEGVKKQLAGPPRRYGN